MTALQRMTIMADSRNVKNNFIIIINQPHAFFTATFIHGLWLNWKIKRTKNKRSEMPFVLRRIMESIVSNNFELLLISEQEQLDSCPLVLSLPTRPPAKSRRLRRKSLEDKEDTGSRVESLCQPIILCCCGQEIICVDSLAKGNILLQRH